MVPTVRMLGRRRDRRQSVSHWAETVPARRCRAPPGGCGCTTRWAARLSAPHRGVSVRAPGGRESIRRRINDDRGVIGMRTRLTTRLGVAGIGALLVLSVTASPAYGQVGSAEPVPPAGLTGLEPTGADMPTVGGNLGNQHYSGLTQITKENLPELAPVWRTHVSAVAPASDDTGQQTTPIVVDGVIYLDTPSGGVIAVDGASGAPIWKWENDVYGLSGTRRGVSAGDGRIFTLAGDNHVVALDAATGEEVWAVQPAGPRARTSGASARSRPCTSTASCTRTPPTATAGPWSRSMRPTAPTSGTSSAGPSAASSSRASTASRSTRRRRGGRCCPTAPTAPRRAVRRRGCTAPWTPSSACTT
ncbi:PQQ-binding-like beta-propeller repeat protein [Agromyces sp. CFH 90414]|uniref:PQQ-binding-like beta-propeller repeat protein n=1 Tax=Agromyces agglutinans TaxID=2662258 RepID=A0A6I2FDB2_9MICO|nr:PQQ-binding-like beta-propeller repeat protein [Agromyces agglutinans]